jgi:hypothetical protein
VAASPRHAICGRHRFQVDLAPVFPAGIPGVLIALAVSPITWPLMDVATRHDSVRFE